MVISEWRGVLCLPGGRPKASPRKDEINGGADEYSKMSIAVSGRVDLTQSAVAKTNRGEVTGKEHSCRVSGSERDGSKLTGRRDGEYFIVQS